jgi:flagellar basal-body rod protein FlgB
MLKVAQNQSDYQLAASLYQKSLQVLRMAVGRGGR